MKKIIALLISALIVSLVFLVTSCDIQKQAAKTKTDTDFKENIETQTFRKGDTVRVVIPKVTYKDTTIYTTNRQGTTIKTVYNQEGKVTSIDCFASAIAEIRKENREFQESVKDKESAKTEGFDSSFVLYLVMGVVLLGLFGLLLLFLYIKNSRP